MKLFIDTAKINEIKEANSWGVISGVTTNPSLIAQCGQGFEETIAAICAEVNGPVSVETVYQTAPEMIEDAGRLAKIAPNVVVKIPMNQEGLKAAKVLSAQGIKTNVTLVFSVNQALLAANVGATYLSPFVGRIDDIGGTGMDLIKDIVPIFEYYGYETQVIAASIRNPLHVVDAAKSGSHISTIPFGVIQQMFKHPLTDIGIEKFNRDWEKVVAAAKA